MTFESKYKELLENEEISRWFDNLMAKSYLTATVYLRGLGYYCELTGATPDTIIQDVCLLGFEYFSKPFLIFSTVKIPELLFLVLIQGNA